MTAVARTTPGGEQAAADRLQGDWDADGTISVHLPIDVAERLLAERGWEVEYAGSGYGDGRRVFYLLPRPLRPQVLASRRGFAGRAHRGERVMPAQADRVGQSPRYVVVAPVWPSKHNLAHCWRCVNAETLHTVASGSRATVQRWCRDANARMAA